jgi:RNA polymerase sigma-70 factor (ECF subfamily)
MPEEAPDKPMSGARHFAQTHWSVVLAAGRGDDARARAALATLCETYWYPLYAYVRRQGYSEEDARDLTQGFFAHLLAHRALARAHPSRGRFRAFLLMSLRHFLANERDRGRSQKRGCGRALVSLDAARAELRFQAEAATHDVPDRAYERNWAHALMEKVLERLRGEQTAAGKGAQFDQLQSCLMAEPDAPRYAELAGRLHSSAEAARMAVSRLRRRYRDLFREEIAHTVNSPAEVEEEIRHLFAVLGS